METPHVYFEYAFQEGRCGGCKHLKSWPCHITEEDAT